jgi:hypothetical protein
MSTDGYGDSLVQISPASTGSKIDTSEVSVAGNTVERQRVVVADPSGPNSLQTVSSSGEAFVREQTVQQLLMDILVELRVLNAMLVRSVGGSDDPERLRAEYYQ